MQVAPAQHHGLKEIESPAHADYCRALAFVRSARIMRCASRHQCFFTLYQMSAASTRFARSKPASFGGGGVGSEDGAYSLIQARVIGLTASGFAKTTPVWPAVHGTIM